MKIGIIGYDIFGTGGTRRSNLNLINEFSMHGDEVIFFNLLPFGKKQVKNIQSELEKPKNVSFYLLQQFPDVAACSSYILTRESLFSFARYIKFRWPEAVVVGEVHAPLDLIEPELDLGVDAVDVYRVATEKIKKRFIKRIKQDNVISFPISGRHIDFSVKKIQSDKQSLNFVVYSRFDERQKDISYAIKLIDYLVHGLGNNKIKLFLNGTGKGENFYRNLVAFYELKDHIFINQTLPKDYIYLSTARFETLGYSIMEAFASGKRIALYRGDDGSLAEIYKGFESVCWLNKNLADDSHALLQFYSEDISKVEENFLHDLTLAKEILDTKNYASDYIAKIMNVSFFKKESQENVDFSRVFEQVKKQSSFRENSFITNVYVKIKNAPLLGKIVGNSIVKDSAKKVLHYLRPANKIADLNDISGELMEDFFFIETFHGKSFAGDPKYIALELRKKFPEAYIYVSSADEWVDMEIMDYGFKPVRVGSEQYIHKFRKAAYVFMNGNSLDKSGKVKGQKFIQTWHGFPLKKMVANLNDLTQRQVESQAFLPRMKKWDYLLSSSKKNTELLKSAFMLNENHNLKIMEHGAPRNSYLIQHKDDETERIRLTTKYFIRPYDPSKKYVLYCPTWRKEKRETVATMDFRKLISLLPDNYEIIIKLHPLESKLFAQYRNLDERIHCFPNEISDIQELFLLSDVLITDYSSAMFDYAHLNKKIIVFQEDLNEYNRQVGWYFDIENLTDIRPQEYNEVSLSREILMLDNMKLYNKKIIETFLNQDTSSSTNQLFDELFDYKGSTVSKC
ncbi:MULTISPECIES: CDP-glycerol glycerophosphotransferase family protein [Enterococcus]|uniref:CDP-glycerol glycerophosphotransferase family protein n=1 Tax=Enterococcus TaxID=1350 RepID=UPI00249E9574|nr:MULTISPECIES: CDP-glycerol glycerophosphotransferase family protein [Enterococcus]MDT2738571.1 CDP-glycerol glycerophosphotransferase family protein [Enterococcus canintestini]WHA08353.1 CDP-glycerol glycerophosphotransferase family protein [Enterococcus montenegrensis]